MCSHPNLLESSRLTNKELVKQDSRKEEDAFNTLWNLTALYTQKKRVTEEGKEMSFCRKVSSLVLIHPNCVVNIINFHVA